MKGVVFTEFIEMVEQKFSTSVANRLLDESDLPSGGAYTAVGTYDHQELVSLVAKLSEISGLPIPALIKAFGIYLFGRFHTLYPAFFEGVTSAADFLSRIEDIVHAEVLKLYPDAELPHFEIARPDSHTMIMTYHSERHFGDLAEGLIEACIEHFGNPLSLTRENLAEAGQPVRFTIRKRERTARKEAERLLEEKSLALYRSNQQLQINAQRYQLLFESSRDALMTLAPPSWKFTSANQATLQLFGASSVAEFTALGPWNVSPELQPDGRPSGEKAQEAIMAAMREGHHFFEWEHQRLDGQPFAADVLLTRMEVGEEVFLQATVRDITKRKKTESQLVAQIEELRRWHEATSGREQRILSIKHEVNELLAKAGQPPRYPSAELKYQKEK